MTKRITLFALAMGKPFPGHRLVMRNWESLSKSVDFYVITDTARAWKKLFVQPKRVNWVDKSVSDVYKLGTDVLGYQSEQDLRDNSTFFATDNIPADAYRLAGLRPIFPEMLNVHVTTWGWIDSDVILSPHVISHIQHHGKLRNMLLSPSKGPLWEQVKVFNVSSLLAEYKNVLKNHYIRAGGPAEARLVYDLALKKDFVSQSSIAVHWAYSDRILSILKNKMSVHMTGEYYMSANTSNILVFVADTEVKTWSHNTVDTVFECLNNNSTIMIDYPSVSVHCLSH